MLPACASCKRRLPVSAIKRFVKWELDCPRCGVTLRVPKPRMWADIPELLILAAPALLAHYALMSALGRLELEAVDSVPPASVTSDS